MSFILNAKELLVPDLRYRFPSVLAPVDLYRVVCHWQHSFPLLKPFYPEGPSVYQVGVVFFTGVFKSTERISSAS